LDKRHDIEIQPYTPHFRDAVLALTIEAWVPVFEKTRHDVPGFVYDAFYPAGWEVRQKKDVGALLDRMPNAIWLAMSGQTLLGFIGLQVHAEDSMGEVHILATAPEHQRQGVGRALLAFAEAHFRAAGLAMVMVETVGDEGHAPARRAYERAGYEPWPVARYFKPL